MHFLIELLQILHSIDLHLQQGCHYLVKAFYSAGNVPVRKAWSVASCGVQSGFRVLEHTTLCQSDLALVGAGEGQDPLHCKPNLYLVWINSVTVRNLGFLVWILRREKSAITVFHLESGPSFTALLLFQNDFQGQAEISWMHGRKWNGFIYSNPY